MTPGIIEKANVIMKGDGEKVVDLPVRSADGMLHSEWTLSDAERAAIAAGHNVQLTIISPRHPPVRLSVAPKPCKCCRAALPTDAPTEFCGICEPIIKASLTEELKTIMKEDPDLEEIGDGTFQLKPEAAKRRAKLVAKARLDAIGCIALGLKDATNIDPTLIASALATIMTTARQ